MPVPESDARRAIDAALREVRVVDPHCHLTPQRPMARTLADIVLYHHVCIEMVSAGMGQRETSSSGMPHELADPALEPAERIRRALPWLPRIRSTTVAMMLRWILEDIYGFHGALLPPDITPDFAREEAVAPIIGKARDGSAASPAELGGVSWLGLHYALERLRSTKLRTIQVILGAEVLSPHRSLTQWGGGFASSFGSLAGQFEDFQFNMSTAADAHIHAPAVFS